MRMAGPDIVLFVVGALLFGGASWAIVQQGGLDALAEPTSALGTFTVTFGASEEEIETREVASFRSVEETFEIDATNVTKVLVTIDCADAQAGNVAEFTLDVTVEGPANVTPVTSSHACAQGLQIPIEVAPVPGDTSVAATTETEAYANLATNANATKAQGTWTVTISGGRAAGPVPVPDQVPPPGGSIGVSVERWTATVTPVQGK